MAGETFAAQTKLCIYCIFFGSLPDFLTVSIGLLTWSSVVIFCGFAVVFGVEVLGLLGSMVTTGGGLLLNSLTRAHVIMLSKYLYTGSLSSSRICNHDFYLSFELKKDTALTLTMRNN